VKILKKLYVSLILNKHERVTHVKKYPCLMVLPNFKSKVMSIFYPNLVHVLLLCPTNLDE